MKPLKAIPTYYNGMKFDSRTEAHWAVFFDTLGIPYIHEPEGFVFSDGTRYLPDFYLPDQKARQAQATPYAISRGVSEDVNYGTCG